MILLSASWAHCPEHRAPLYSWIRCICQGRIDVEKTGNEREALQWNQQRIGAKQTGDASKMVAVGDAAPAFAGCGPDLKLVTNEAFAGKTVVLSFFPASFSGAPDDGCEMQLCSMNAVAAAADKEKFAFYGVSGDLPFANKAFAQKLALSFPLLSDPTLATCARFVGKCAFGSFFSEHSISDALEGCVTSNRGCVVVGSDGKVVYAFSGDGHPGKQPDMSVIRKIVS